jgi:uncharacterized protein (DUF433 family)
MGISYRDALIVERWRGGATQTDIGYEFDLTRERIRQILAKQVPDEYYGRRHERRERRRLAAICPKCQGEKHEDAKHCRSCAPMGAPQFWTPPLVVERIRAWVELYGNIPAATDWNPSMARLNGRPDIADRFYADGCWPHYSTVVARFGSWNAGIEAAGFTPRATGHRDNPRGRRPLAVALAVQEAA